MDAVKCDICNTLAEKRTHLILNDEIAAHCVKPIYYIKIMECESVLCVIHPFSMLSLFPLHLWSGQENGSVFATRVHEYV